ncbi:MarR family winged helix-turn-helix transcriptional regulator [Aeromicrobium sp. CF4.19]|uniref:MarR family winged helix-turn-helix transcriptional regulator n=1 Tax=Aeromicrobium sp. CF4.19 TaxID=3373082 RepID=UPI003EE71C87
MDRVDNLLGALALTLSDRMTTASSAGTSSEQAALVTLLAHPGRPVAWLAAVLDLTDSGATRLVDRLARDELVHRERGGDARRREVHLTDAGRERAHEYLTARNGALEVVTRALTAEQRHMLEQILEPLVAGLAESRLPALATCRLCDRPACNEPSTECPLEHTMSGEDPHA